MADVPNEAPTQGWCVPGIKRCPLQQGSLKMDLAAEDEKGASTKEDEAMLVTAEHAAALPFAPFKCFKRSKKDLEQTPQRREGLF